MNLDRHVEKLEKILCSIAPISGVLHIGPGNGSMISQYEDWGVENIIFVEADEYSYNKLKLKTKKHTYWRTIYGAIILNPVSAFTVFYLRNQCRENSVTPTEQLQDIWKNIKTLKTTTVPAFTLVDIWNNNPHKIPNWLLIDCLTTIDIIKSAGETLTQYEVICARVIVEKKEELDNILNINNYICISVEEELNPKLKTAIYIRNWKSIVESKIEN